MVQVDQNSTQVQVSEFFIVGFPSLQQEYFHLVAWFFFILYVITVVGNMVLVVVFALEPNLQKPMYINMVSLALSDIGFTTVALPKLIARYWWNDGSIGFHTCHFQKHMIYYFGSLNSLILLTMAVDRYLAICFPLRYPMVMTIQTMTVLTVLCWVTAHIFPGISTFFTAQMSYCGPNQIVQAFCDTASLLALVCGDTSYAYSVSYISAMFILYVPLGFIIFSYVCIVLTVLQMVNGQGRMKAFSTCATQGFIISVYYLPRFFVYTAPYIPNFQMTEDRRMVTILFYSFFPPLINPFVYCLRTKKIPEILRLWIQKHKTSPIQNIAGPELH
ncbi:olfactory receptor 1 [Austrofundulus limnaeus]|uniref:Olfactory receptor n=1 Tax=Austrofundulus limnaeus TaxID=52670 RepID=A0A2I4ATF3_AUSLI|nr:PREDICTED: olfactory receptor 1-like [Austrofundulus limnaeus]